MCSGQSPTGEGLLPVLQKYNTGITTTSHWEHYQAERGSTMKLKDSSKICFSLKERERADQHPIIIQRMIMSASISTQQKHGYIFSRVILIGLKFSPSYPDGCIPLVLLAIGVPLTAHGESSAQFTNIYAPFHFSISQELLQE